MKLDSQRIYLKKLSLEELNGNYVSWLNDPEVCRFNAHGESEYTQEKATDFIQSLAGDTAREVWAVYLKQPHVHIGNIALQSIDLKNKNAEIAYLFGEKEYWGKGYAMEASVLLLRRGFEELKLHRIYFGTHIENLQMQRLGEKLGFVKEGILKDAQFKFGKYNDVVIFARLAP
jgi:RimJ/RimL family protein N-acetyltransferase